MSAVDCTHENARPTQYTLSNNTIAIYRQCDDCGEKVGTAISRATIPDWQTLPPFDVEKQDRRRAETREFYAAKRAERLAEFDGKNGEFWNNYTKYLNTPEWQQVRRRALVRDNFTCQNCFQKLTDYNAHAHHLTYESYKRIGVTYVFEVVTLCPKCHADYHGK